MITFKTYHSINIKLLIQQIFIVYLILAMCCCSYGEWSNKQYRQDLCFQGTYLMEEREGLLANIYYIRWFQRVLNAVDPWTMWGLGVPTPMHNWTPTYNIWLPQILTTVTHWYPQKIGSTVPPPRNQTPQIPCMKRIELCIQLILDIFGFPTMDGKYHLFSIHGCLSLRMQNSGIWGNNSIFIGNNPHIGGPTQFKSVLFKEKRYGKYNEKLPYS